MFILAPAIIALGATIVQTEAGRVRSPGISPGEIGSTAQQIAALRRRGLKPTLVVDPFTGGLVLATEDQFPNLEGILRERFERRLLTPSAEEAQAIFRARQELMDRTAASGAVQSAKVRAAAQEPTPMFKSTGRLSREVPGAQLRETGDPCRGLGLAARAICEGGRI